MRHTFLLFAALIVGVVCFTGCNFSGPTKSGASRQAQPDKAAEDLARQERDRIAEQEDRERRRVADEQAEKERRKTNIEMVLREDAKSAVGITSVAEIVTRMRDIDISGCPDDFRLAYVDHIHAWESMRDVERNAIALKREANSDGIVVEAVVRGLLGDPLGTANQIVAAQTQLQREYQAAHTEIKETFDRVEDIAVKNSANLPR